MMALLKSDYMDDEVYELTLTDGPDGEECTMEFLTDVCGGEVEWNPYEECLEMSHDTFDRCYALVTKQQVINNAVCSAKFQRLSAGKKKEFKQCDCGVIDWTLDRQMSFLREHGCFE